MMTGNSLMPLQRRVTESSHDLVVKCADARLFSTQDDVESRLGGPKKYKL